MLWAYHSFQIGGEEVFSNETGYHGGTWQLGALGNLRDVSSSQKEKSLCQWCRYAACPHVICSWFTMALIIFTLQLDLHAKKARISLSASMLGLVQEDPCVLHMSHMTCYPWLLSISRRNGWKRNWATVYLECILRSPVSNYRFWIKRGWSHQCSWCP